MKKLISYEDAISSIMSSVDIKKSICIKSIYDLDKDILAMDVKAFRDAPAFDNSAMDGYALNSGDDSDEFSIVQSIFAGDYENYSISKGECAKIMTGAKMPIGADCVVPFDDVIFADEKVAKLPKLKTGANFRKQAEELKKGDNLLEKGCVLDGVNISLLAFNGKSFVDVYSKAKIAIISSGEEIIEPWENAGEFATYNSNSVAIKSILKDNGFNADYKGVLPDNLEKMIEFISSLKSYDFIISTGGVSMGEADFMKEAYEANNMKTIFHKINLKPAKPVLFGSMNDTRIFALPGNPMSCMLATFNFILPALRKNAGYSECFNSPIQVKNKTYFKVAKYKANIILGKVENNEFEAIRNNRYNSGMISPLRDANAMAIFHNEIDDVAKDTMINVVLFNNANYMTSMKYLNK